MPKARASGPLHCGSVDGMLGNRANIGGGRAGYPNFKVIKVNVPPAAIPEPLSIVLMAFAAVSADHAQWYAESPRAGNLLLGSDHLARCVVPAE